MSKEPSSPPPSAEQVALADWVAGRARFLVIGLLKRGQPMLHRESGLYLGSVGCMLTQESNAYVRQYNARIQALLQKFGLPSWAPGSRLPARRRLLELLFETQPVTTQEQLEALRLDSLDYSLRGSDLVPAVVFRRLEDLGLLLLGSDVSAMKGCIDVLDLREETWLASEEFDRREYGRMPWDSLPRDAKDAVRARHEAEKAAWDEAYARHRAELVARKRRAELNRQRCAELVEEMKERDLACPHCQVLTRGFRFLPRSECFVCPNCSRSSDALAFSLPPKGS
ncbi:hypothetical protein KYC5002_50000 [Archangium violaceum]|uniref:hypothetical protein n=1 Tax=Archangium violaceum TaxID=83451 RepID=UPI002B28EA19|nr:hypothetical protein KYC5002_50000 [Archangium gephyra]